MEHKKKFPKTYLNLKKVSAAMIFKEHVRIHLFV